MTDIVEEARFRLRSAQGRLALFQVIYVENFQVACHAFKSLVCLLQLAQAIIGTQCRCHGGEQPRARQFRFRPIVVDVIVANDILFRCIARVPGAQDNARHRQAQRIPNDADQTQAGIIGFHHHIEQDDGYVIGF